MARQAERLLGDELAIVNALNVFPVPDGDTGTNMLATIRGALSEVGSAADAATVAPRLAHGALMSARGNSGVILSQLFRAQEETLAERASDRGLSDGELASMIQRAADLAYDTVSDPVEGTMLSVLSALAGAVGERESEAGQVLDRLLEATAAAVAVTPDQLPILREAEVVDSGAYGLLLVFRGWYEALAGSAAPPSKRPLLGVDRARRQAASGAAHPADLLAAHQGGYGYCISLLVETTAADEDAVRRRLSEFGSSVLVVAVEEQLKLHLHAADPGPVLVYAQQLGRLVHSEISNIDEQAAGVHKVARLPIVAVAPGEGLARVFRGIGAAVLAGGPGQNPSTAELLAACEGLPSPVFLLPNHPNVLPVAQEAAKLRAHLFVMATRSVSQGVAAVLAYDEQAQREANLERMARAAANVVSAEIVRASRKVTIGGVPVEPGDRMVLLEGELVGIGDAGIVTLANRLALSSPDLLTIYYGAAATQEQAERLASQLRANLTNLDVEIVRGDQPHAEFTLGFE
ncbi:MAG TPA: DAK2 domain-containing protein [Chloroflexota bacterium]|nr:DAK2 domain-containing protein [Chloroflexota bacterium]